jgi:hypothetical protein
LVAEKVTNEVAWMQYLTEKTKIPIPRVHAFGTSVELPLGQPFILMDYIQGVNLRNFLRELPQIGQDTDADLKRSGIYEQVSEVYLQLYDLPCARIGSISKDEQGEWEITKRPLTMQMYNLLYQVPQFPTQDWPSGPLDSCDDYFRFVVAQQQHQLWTLRNLNIPRERERGQTMPKQRKFGQEIDMEKASRLATLRFRARQGFAHLIQTRTTSESTNKNDFFQPFNPDFDPRNMLYEPSTGTITGVIDFEFMNAMPWQFATDPPLWLNRGLPSTCLDMGHFPWYKMTNEPYLALFLNAMKCAEQKIGLHNDKAPLSKLMKESWHSGRCWINYAANDTDFVDALYWEEFSQLVEEDRQALEEKDELDAYLKHTKNQIEDFEKERLVRSSR